MKRRSRARLKRLLEAVSDRRPIDWDAERATGPEIPQWIDAVRLLQGVAAVHQAHGSLTNKAGRSGHTEAEPKRRRRTGRGRGPPTGKTVVRKQKIEATGRWGPLYLLERIGEGSFGEVFRAFDPALEIEVALKLRHDSSDRLSRQGQILQEARRLARIRHPNVLVVHGVARHGGRVGMWTELVGGQTLEEWLAVSQPIGSAEAALVGIQLCRALTALHAARLVHRDVTTQNVMRERGGRIVLMDFGAVREVDASGYLNPREPRMGTPLAMAPEVLCGEPASPASDVYGVGALLYRIVTGSFPVPAQSFEELLSRHAGGERHRLLDHRPDLDDVFASVVESALDPRPEGRHSSAGALERALNGCIEVHDRASTAVSVDGTARELGPTNLPVPLTSFEGRVRELRECADLLTRGRLLTLTGFGGCGKTRLAISVAGELRVRFRDGVWFVDLARLNDSSQVPQALASAINVRERHGATLLESLEDGLRSMTTLIVLDNCEHVVGASSELVRWILAVCDRVRILATSREALGVEGEQIFTVLPLPLPENPETAPAFRIAEAESVRLFLERARLVRRDFQLNDENAGAVAGICRRLEGIPLALELAAAKMRMMTPEETLARITGHLGSLTREVPTEVARHQTLHAAFRWSYDLLTVPERTLLNTLTVFVGTWRLEDAAAVHGEEESGVMRTLTRLVGKSLVSVDQSNRYSTCYRLLEPVRELTAKELDPQWAETLRERHATHFLAQATPIEAGLEGPEQARWLDLVESEHSNFLAAIEWASTLGPAGRSPGCDAVAALQLAAAMWRYWYLRGHFTLGRGVLSRAMAAKGQEGSAGVRAKALWASGFLATFQGDSEAASPRFEQSLDLFLAAGDERGVARAHSGLGIVATDRGDYSSARPHYERSLSVLRSAGTEGEVAMALNNLGAVTWRLGDHATAGALHAEGLERARRVGHRGALMLNIINLTWIALRQGRFDEARGWLLEVLPIILELGARQMAAEVFEMTTEVLADGGAWGLAVSLAGTAEALRDSIGAPPEVPWRQAQQEFRARALRMLGRDLYASAWTAGQNLEFRQAGVQATRWLKELATA